MQHDTTRREFLKTGTTALAAGALAELAIPSSVHAAGSDMLRIGLVGCGHRGTGAAVQALKADPNTKLVALADAFDDRLEYALGELQKDPEVGTRVAVDKDHRFAGFDAYQKLIDSVDVVLLATPPHFRPLHLQAAVTAGKHVFAEKPVAVDVPGLNKIRAACDEAKQKNLSVVSGLHNRYNYDIRATMAKIHDGAIGDILFVQSAWNGNMPAKPWPMIRKEGWSDMEYQLRNWYFWSWLSGDHVVEQAIHSIDKGLWAMKDLPPKSAVGLGGLQVRMAPDPEQVKELNSKVGKPGGPPAPVTSDRGQNFDHHTVVHEYENGCKHLHTCRQQRNCANEISCWVVGTKGRCHVDPSKGGGVIYDLDGKIVWKGPNKKENPYQVEHNELFAGLRGGKIINNGDYMIQSTMVAIFGRMATYTGQKITWQQALASKQDMSPTKYEWGPLPTPTVALPGITKFV